MVESAVIDSLVMTDLRLNSGGCSMMPYSHVDLSQTERFPPTVFLPVGNYVQLFCCLAFLLGRWDLIVSKFPLGKFKH